MNFTKKIWDLILKFYIKKYIYIKDLNCFTKQPNSLMPAIFWKKKNFKKINKKKKLKVKSLLKIKLHNGKIYVYKSIRNYKIPLLYYTQPITYGKKKEKKKLQKKIAKKKKKTGQQGKFLLNKAAYSMPWKYNILDLNDKRNLFFKSKLFISIFEFFLKKSIYLSFLKKKNIKFKNYHSNIKILNYRQKATKKLAKRIYLSQLVITKFNSWVIFKINIYLILKKKKKLIVKSNESFFRLKHLYYYLTPSSNKF
jgi:hypothetical protein